MLDELPFLARYSGFRMRIGRAPSYGAGPRSEFGGLPALIFAGRRAPTFPAGPATIRREDCVRFVETMPTMAMCLGRVRGSESLATKYILSSRNRLQVRRVDASSISAKVVDCQTFWNRTNQEFIHCAVSHHHPSTHSYRAIAIRAQ
jgi:hypothetical protein